MMTLEKVLRACKSRCFWSAAIEADTIAKALKISLVVGTGMILINQGDLLLRGIIPPCWKLVLGYCVPYGASTYSVAVFKMARSDRIRDVEEVI